MIDCESIHTACTVLAKNCTNLSQKSSTSVEPNADNCGDPQTCALLHGSVFKERTRQSQCLVRTDLSTVPAHAGRWSHDEQYIAGVYPCQARFGLILRAWRQTSGRCFERTISLSSQ